MPSQPAPTTIEINGFAVRALRKLSTCSIADLALRIEKDRSYVNHIELGGRTRVSPEVFNALVAALALEDRRAILADPHGARAVRDLAV